MKQSTVDEVVSDEQTKDIDGATEGSQQDHDIRAASSSGRQQHEDRKYTVDEEKFARQLKQLVAAVRDKVDTLDQCIAVDQPCHGDDEGGPGCCRGLRCSSGARCVLDCVSEGQSCRHNWFCCDGSRCNHRNGGFICE